MIILYLFKFEFFFTLITFCLFVSIGANQRFCGVRGGGNWKLKEFFQKIFRVE